VFDSITRGVTLAGTVTHQTAIAQGVALAATVAHETAREKGFWQDYDKAEAVGMADGVREAFLSQKLALIMTEVAEAVEDLRKGNDDHLAEELADIIIRTLDLGEALRYDMGEALVRKMRTNATRTRKHGKSF